MEERQVPLPRETNRVRIMLHNRQREAQKRLRSGQKVTEEAPTPVNTKKRRLPTARKSTGGKTPRNVSGGKRPRQIATLPGPIAGGAGARGRITPNSIYAVSGDPELNADSSDSDSEHSGSELPTSKRPRVVDDDSEDDAYEPPSEGESESGSDASDSEMDSNDREKDPDDSGSDTEGEQE